MTAEESGFRGERIIRFSWAAAIISLHSVWETEQIARKILNVAFVRGEAELRLAAMFLCLHQKQEVILRMIVLGGSGGHVYVLCGISVKRTHGTVRVIW